MPGVMLKTEKRIKFARKLGKLWGKVILFHLKLICNISYKIHNIDTILRNEPCIIACKHQSMFETVLFLATLPEVVYVVKDELMHIPVYGKYLREMGMIPVKREQKLSAIKEMNYTVSNCLKSVSVVIFPEGSRIPYGTKIECKSGIFSIYRSSNATVIPVSVNSGLTWPKDITRKTAGTIDVFVHDPLPMNMQKEEMLQTLNDKINAHNEII